MKQRKTIMTAVLAAAACVASQAEAQWNVPSPKVDVLPDHADGIYKVGETMRWTVEWRIDGDVPSGVRYSIKSGSRTEVTSGELKFEGRTAHFESTLDAPNTLLATVSWNGGGPGKQAFGGAVAAPYEIQPAAAEPEDFDAFWSAKLAELRKIKPVARLTEADAGVPNVTYAKVAIDSYNGAKVQGQIARPKDGAKFPAILIPQWAGVYGLQKAWATDRARDGWLALNIQAHDIPIDEPADYYTKLYGNGGALQNYWKIGNESRDTSYYLRMYLSACQAVEYLKTRDDWDGKTIVIMGGSQGGQQALAVAGLMPESITATLAMLPAACDNWAESAGRRSGFPFWWDQTDGRDADAVRRTSKYFDPACFAKRIKCPVLSGCGLKDDLAPPSSVLAAFNPIAAPKEFVMMARAGHVDENGSQQAYHARAYGAWLPALLKGEVPPMPVK